MRKCPSLVQMLRAAAAATTLSFSILIKLSSLYFTPACKIITSYFGSSDNGRIGQSIHAILDSATCENVPNLCTPRGPEDRNCSSNEYFLFACLDSLPWRLSFQEEAFDLYSAKYRFTSLLYSEVLFILAIKFQQLIFLSISTSSSACHFSTQCKNNGTRLTKEVEQQGDEGHKRTSEQQGGASKLLRRECARMNECTYVRVWRRIDNKLKIVAESPTTPNAPSVPS